MAQQQQPLELALLEELRSHTARYPGVATQALRQLQELWADQEVAPGQQTAELAAVIAAAEGAWSGAVQAAQEQQQKLRDSIQAALQRIADIKQKLGDAELHAPPTTGGGPHRTLRAWQLDVQAKAAHWEAALKQRLGQHADLEARTRVLRAICGLPAQPRLEAPDVSGAGMELARLELQHLAADKERREDVLRGLLDELTAVCADVGEDARAAVAGVAPNLLYLWDAEAVRVLRSVYSLGSSFSTSVAAAVDLSDGTIAAVTSKLAAVRDLKASRAAHAASLLGVLQSLWEEAASDDVGSAADTQRQRAHIEALLGGALRLHAASLEAAMAEVGRLQAARFEAMLGVMRAKRRQLAELCAESLVAEPEGVDAALEAALSGPGGGGGDPGAVAQLLSKLLAMLAEVQVLAVKRGHITGAIRELEGAHAESAWLAEYEADEGRYKGRDANKKLQRAIKAAKLRDRLPTMIADLRALLAAWRESEGGEAFRVESGRDYEWEMLEPLQAAVEEEAASRAAKAAAATTRRRQSLAGAPAAASPSTTRLTTPRKAPAAAAAAAAASPGLPPRRAGGPATPAALRGVGGRSLTERHSICVGARDREPTAAHAGPAALSRSGEVRLPQRASSAAGNRRRSSGGGADVAGHKDSAAAAVTPPAAKVAAASSGGANGSAQRASTGSKLKSIFASPVPHTVATLSKGEPQQADTAAADQAPQA